MGRSGVRDVVSEKYLYIVRQLFLLFGIRSPSCSLVFDQPWRDETWQFLSKTSLASLVGAGLAPAQARPPRSFIGTHIYWPW